MCSKRKGGVCVCKVVRLVLGTPYIPGMPEKLYERVIPLSHICTIPKQQREHLHHIWQNIHQEYSRVELRDGMQLQDS